MDGSARDIDRPFDDLDKRERRTLKKFVASLLSGRRRTAAYDEEDIAQESLMELFRAKQRGETIQFPRAYLRTTARRKVFRAGTTGTKGAEQPMDDSESELGKAAVKQFQDDGNELFLKFQIEQLLASMTDRDRKICTGFFVEGRSAREVSLLLGTTPEAINTAVSKIRRMVKAKLIG